MSTKYCGYCGKVLKVNLTDRSVSEYPFSDKDREKYLGGKIMAAKIIADHIKGKIDPLSEENVIVVTTGPLNALGAPCSTRFNTSTISPLTGYYTSSNCGGNFGMSLKRAGYDALIITGKSEEKVYLKVTEGGVEFKDATPYWGMKTGEAQEQIPDKGEKFVIGPVGENLVRYACVVSNERAAGRGGVGAVFGSKNLKGIVADGHVTPKIFNEEKYKTNNENGGYLVVLEGLGLSVNPYTTHGKGVLCAMFQDLMEACSVGGNCLFTTYAFFPTFLMSKPNSIVTRVVNKVMTELGLVIKLLLRVPNAIAMHMPFEMLPHTKAIYYATGMKMNFGKYLRIGERGYNLERLIDIKLGVSEKDDDLPERLKSELQIATNPKSKVPLDKLRAKYYKARFWDEHGRPTKKLIKRLGLEDVL